MELEITSEQQNPLIRRNEIKGIVINNTAPHKFDIAKIIAEKYSVPVDALRVLTIHGKYGTNEFGIVANVYESKEERDKFEAVSKKEKEQETKALEADAAPAEEAPAEESKEAAPAEEKPVEESKEATPAEESKEAAPAAEESKPEASVKEAPAEEKSE